MVYVRDYGDVSNFHVRAFLNTRDYIPRLCALQTFYKQIDKLPDLGKISPQITKRDSQWNKTAGDRFTVG